MCLCSVWSMTIGTYVAHCSGLFLVYELNVITNNTIAITIIITDVCSTREQILISSQVSRLRVGCS